MPVISCVFAPSLDTPAHIELAERLGYRRAWCYDSPAVYADPWMVLALAAAYHAIYESKGADGLDKLPGGREWREAVEAAEVPRRHLGVHDGHLVALGKHDEALLARAAPLLASWTMTGTRADIGARLRALTSAGITEVAYQPMGPDIPRELAAFARAAGLADSGEEGA